MTAFVGDFRSHKPVHAQLPPFHSKLWTGNDDCANGAMSKLWITWLRWGFQSWSYQQQGSLLNFKVSFYIIVDIRLPKVPTKIVPRQEGQKGVLQLQNLQHDIVEKIQKPQRYPPKISKQRLWSELSWSCWQSRMQCLCALLVASWSRHFYDL